MYSSGGGLAHPRVGRGATRGREENTRHVFFFRAPFGYNSILFWSGCGWSRKPLALPIHSEPPFSPALFSVCSCRPAPFSSFSVHSPVSINPTMCVATTGYRKVHRFSLQDCEIMHAVFDGEGAARLSCPPVQLSQVWLVVRAYLRTYTHTRMAEGSEKSQLARMVRR